MAGLFSAAPSISSSSSLIPQFHFLPIIDERTHLKFHTHFSNLSIQSSYDEEYSSEPQPPNESPEMKITNKKKKNRKLRPSFYDQTVERWSVKISSRRSKFPWEEQRSSFEGLPSNHNFLESSKITHLDSKHVVENPLKSSSHLVVEKSDSSKEIIGSEDTPLDVPLGVQRGFAPWVHGAGRMDFKFNGDDEKQNDSLGQSNVNDKEMSKFDRSTILPSTLTEEEKASQRDSSGQNLRNVVMQTLRFKEQHGKGSVSLIVDELKNSFDQNTPNRNAGDSSNGVVSDVIKLTGPVQLPWERENRDSDGEWSRKRSNTELAERTIPEHELRRLRNVALRMKERMKVGAAGVTDSVVDGIHKKWKVDEVVKLRFEGPPTLHMKRTHEILERKTGGIVIWRSGSSIVLYRGTTYQLPCVQSYAKPADTDSDRKTFSSVEVSDNEAATSTIDSFAKKPSFSYAPKGSSESFDIDSFLDQLGPRYKDWSGCNPLPVDADKLPGVVPGYMPPFRLLPYKTKVGLKDSQMTSLRRLARTISPHFALGRNRQHQGLARAMVKLWEKSAIAKIAIKRGVPNTCNERMAEEIKKLTGGVLLSRNKEYIVFYRGNDFVVPSIRKVLVEKQKLAITQQDEEEAARLRASDLIVLNDKTAKGPLLAGTLAETLEANTRWGHQPSTEEREKMRRDLAFEKHASVVRYLERKLAFAKAKVRKAERALVKVQEFLDPAELPTDLETVTDEERALFRSMGLKMRAYLLLGRRGVFGGTVENMHLNWKHRELVKIIVRGKSFAQAKHIAISLEAESGGILISLDKTTKGYAIIVYRGKNYQRPDTLKPKNLLTKRQALSRAIELQRREALNHHISHLHERIQMLKSQLDKVEVDQELGNVNLDKESHASLHFDEDMEDEGEEAYLETYSSGDELCDDDASVDEF